MSLAVNYDTVSTAAGDVTVTARELTTGLETLMAKVKVVTDTWDGDARVAYEDIQRSVASEMAEMNAKLDNIGKLLHRSLEGYRDTDKGNAARFRMQM